MSNFQVVVMGIFMAFIVIAVLIFSGVIPGFGASKSSFGGEVVLWGTIPDNKMRSLVEDFNSENKDSFILKYKSVPENTFENNLIEALAAGVGPDLFFLPQDMILKNEDKVFIIPYKSITERDFKNSFIEEGELYLTNKGILAFPFLIDPMVMYWNKDILSSSGVAREPMFWDEFFTLAPILISSDNAKNIKKSIVAFGEFVNITNAKDVLSMLFIQSGDNIVEKNKEGNNDLVFGRNYNNKTPAESALRFFTEFSNPAKPFYSWNRSLPNSKDMFISGDLAFYFGYSSELSDIITKNSHLNFSVSMVPQIRDSAKRITFGRMQGVAIAKNSKKQNTAFRVAYLLSGSDFLGKLSKNTNLPPVRRDMLSQKQTDQYKSVFYDSAIIAKGWLDPNPNMTYNIFKDMVENISSGRNRISSSVQNASSEMKRLVK
jgi:ABC-type glycerol-3-phosphate transport system substrate-binding protein